MYDIPFMLRWIFITLLFPAILSAQLKRFQYSENKMGSPFTIIFYHIDSAEALSTAKECFTIVDSLTNIFSDYSSSSEVGLLSKKQTTQAQLRSEERRVGKECRL